MSIGLWKSFLSLAKTAAVLILLVSAFLFWRHREAMADPYEPPSFQTEVRGIRNEVPDVKNLSLTLGRFQRVGEKVEKPPEEERAPAITDVIGKLCEITDAFVCYPPYGADRPAINIRWKQKPPGETEDTRRIGLGEALIEKQHPNYPQLRIPVQYKFIGCERDPQNPGFTYFLFDTNCDGKVIQKARWKLEQDQPPNAPTPTSEAPDQGSTVATKEVYIGPSLGAGVPPPEERAPEPVAPPVETAPVPEPQPLRAETVPSDSIFEEENGAFAATTDGVEYLKDNYEQLLQETRTQTYRDRDGRAAGLRIVGIKNTSVANQFGIRPDDVILAINGRGVSDQSEAVNVVKAELRKKVPIIRVSILRQGRTIEKRYDTRDPETRRAAARTFR